MKIFHLLKVIHVNSSLNYCLFFFLVSAFSLVTAQNKHKSTIIQITKDLDKLDGLNAKASILEDSTNNLSLSQIQEQRGFIPYLSFVKSKGGLKKKRTYWVKLIFKNLSSRSHWVLYTGWGAYIDLYAPNEKNVYKKSISGRFVPGSQRDIKSIIVEGRYKFHLTLSQKRNTIIYVKLFGKIFNPKYDLKLVNPDIFYKKSANAKIIQSIFQGALWIIILYNLILFFLVKDRTYLLYVLYVFSYSVYYLTYYDLVNDYPVIQVIVAIASSQSSMLFYFLFMVKFVRSQDLIPKWHNIIKKWIIVKWIYWGGLFLYISITLDIISTEAFILPFLLIEGVIFIITLIILFRSKNQLARYFIFGSFFLILGFILSAISFSLNISFEENYFSQAGIFLELVLFSVGLGYRERKNEQEKRLAQEENARILREQNVTLERKVKERTKEISEKNEELHLQKEEILTQRDALQERGEELQFAYNQITDSVRYAQTIQTAILPFERRIQRAFDEYFIIYQPKDIVSGDFYWFNTMDASPSPKTVVSVIDCTGHGVPGAFMSMIGNTLLNETINEKQIFDPSEVLSRLHLKIRSDLRQAETNNSDGMDMALCVIEGLPDEQFKLTYSGAKRPLFYVQEGELAQLKADRFSIGGEVYDDERKRVFTNKEIILQKGDMFYLMTDGFGDTPDAERKRFGSRNIKKMIMANTHLSMAAQQTAFEATLANHQGSEEARDDVTMLGFRL